MHKSCSAKLDSHAFVLQSAVEEQTVIIIDFPRGVERNDTKYLQGCK